MLTVFHTKKFLKDYCIRNFPFVNLTSFPRKNLKLHTNTKILQSKMPSKPIFSSYSSHHRGAQLYVEQVACTLYYNN